MATVGRKLSTFIFKKEVAAEAPPPKPISASMSVIPVADGMAASAAFAEVAARNSAPLVAVTGGLSFVGSHIVAELLHRGYYVRTVIPQGAKTDFLFAFPGADRRLQVVAVRDLAAEDARASLLLAFRGAFHVIHAASFGAHSAKLSKQIASKRIVDSLKLVLDVAAVQGTTVRRFLYLSSDSTIYDPLTHPSNEDVTLSENDWFDVARSGRENSEPFPFARTVAEMRLWARFGRSTLPYSVCSVVPSFVLGPVLSERHIISTPNINFVYNVINGSLTTLPNVPTPPVDVRDVAWTFAELLSRIEVSGRILLCAESMTALDIIKRSAAVYPRYPWPALVKKSKWKLFQLKKDHAEIRKKLKVAEFASSDRRGHQYSLRRTRAVEELGLVFRPVDETLRATMDSLVLFAAVADRRINWDPEKDSRKSKASAPAAAS